MKTISIRALATASLGLFSLFAPSSLVSPQVLCAIRDDCCRVCSTLQGDVVLGMGHIGSHAGSGHRWQ